MAIKKVKFTASTLSNFDMDVLEAKVQILTTYGWYVTKREYRHDELTLVVVMEEGRLDELADGERREGEWQS